MLGKEMSGRDWISVGEFDSLISAEVVSKRLSADRVPNRIVAEPVFGPGGPEATRWIWVPPEWQDQAKKISAEDAVTEEELARVALGYPPPDDV